MTIGSEEAKGIERRIGEVEAATGVQVVAAIVPQADAYPEAQWRAFALAVSLAALGAVALDVGRPDWLTTGALLVQALVILGAGALAALLARYVRAVRRRFIREGRGRAETRQCAEGMFLVRELFATPQRTTVLILVAELERQVVVVPDTGHARRIAAQEWQRVVDAMTPLLHAGRTAAAFDAGLGVLQSLLLAKGHGPGDRANRVADALIRGEAP